MKKLPIKTVIADIETSPVLAMVWGTGKTSISIDQLIPKYFTKIICISWRWFGEKKTHRVEWDANMDDKQLLLDFLEQTQEAEAIIGHNEKSFDIKIINARIAFHGLKTQLPLMTIEDTLLLARRSFRLPSMKLAYLLQYFGIKQLKLKTDMALWIDVCYFNDRERLKYMGKYCDRDVDSLHALYAKIRPYLKSQINIATIKQDREGCSSCGKKVHSKGFVRTLLGKFQRWHCPHCGSNGRFGKNLLSSTVEFPRGQ